MTVRLRWLAMLAGFFVLMISVGSIPGEAQSLSAHVSDKMLHALAYGFMTVLCFHALGTQRWWRALLTLCVIALLGFIDEAIQSFLPYRNASVADWCFDIGMAAAVAALLLWLEKPSLSTEPHAKN